VYEWETRHAHATDLRRYIHGEPGLDARRPENYLFFPRKGRSVQRLLEARRWRGDALPLTESRNQKHPSSWRPDGKVLAYTQLDPDTSWDILTLAIEGDEKSSWKPGEAKALPEQPFQRSGCCFLA